MFTPKRIIFRSTIKDAPKSPGLNFKLRVEGILGNLELGISAPGLGGGVQRLKEMFKGGVAIVRDLISENLAQPGGEAREVGDEREHRSNEVDEKEKMSPQLESVQKIKDRLNRIKKSPGAKGNNGEEDAFCLAILKELHALKRFVKVLNQDDADALRDYLDEESELISNRLENLKTELAENEREIAKIEPEARASRIDGERLILLLSKKERLSKKEQVLGRQYKAFIEEPTILEESGKKTPVVDATVGANADTTVVTPVVDDAAAEPVTGATGEAT